MNNRNVDQSSAAWYALRRTLPVWSFEQNLAELTEVLPRYRVDEVIVKVDTEEFTHGQPPLDWVRAYQPQLFRVRDELLRLGIRYSINPWITVGHNDRGRDATLQVPGLQTMTGHDGVRCTCCACPLCPAWRAHAAEVWSLYAETEPAVIWIEDDIRTFNHVPVLFGCFCPLHLERFSSLAGESVDRETLVHNLLAPGTPHPWRALFLQMQGEIMAETVAFLAQTVHAVSPDTSMGLMSSGPNNHCLDGRLWPEFAAALADGRPLYSRPPMSNYCEGSLRGFYYSHDSIKCTRHCLPADTIEQTELESVPFTRFSKSVAATLLELSISFAYGCSGVTMNLYDHCGTPMESEPWFGEMLGREKDYFSALAEICGGVGVFAGVQLLQHQNGSVHKQLRPGAEYREMIPEGAKMMETMEAHGIPTTYAESPVVAAAGQVWRALPDARIRELLGRGVILDAVAAGVLFERGFAAEIGLEAWQQPVFLDELGPLAAEEFHAEQFGGRDKMFLTLTVPNLSGRPSVSLLQPASAAIVLSHLVDPDACRRQIASYAFANSLGGRVIVLSYELETAVGVSWFHPFRQTMLQNAVRWLSRNRPPVLVSGDGVYPLAFRKDCGSRTVLGLFNLSLDPWKTIEFEFAGPHGDAAPVSARILQPDGSSRTHTDLCVTNTGNGCLRLRFNEDTVGALSFAKPFVAELAWE